MSTVDQSKRNELDFPRLAAERFGFLTKEPYGLQAVKKEPLALRYEGNGVVCVVFHERLSYELGVALWRPTEQREVERPYTISDLMRVTDPKASRRYRRFAATSKDSLGRGLTKLAEDLEKYGASAIRNEPEFFHRLSAAREEAISEFGSAMVDQSARTEAEAAWRNGDFYRVARAYGRIESRLSPVERKKLNHAREQIAGK